MAANPLEMERRVTRLGLEEFEAAISLEFDL
jgi:hypothetical protein